MPDATVNSLRTVFSDMFVLYFRSHIFHWNVQSVLFPQWHDFFGKIYNQAWSSLDDIAEHIRACGELAPADIHDWMGRAQLPIQTHTPGTPSEMVSELLALNTALLGGLNTAHSNASAERAHGVVNYLEGLIDAHEKLNWMLKSSL